MEKPVSVLEFSPDFPDEAARFLTGILDDEFHFTRSRPDLTDIATHYQQDGGNFWIALHEGRIVGTIGLLSFPGGKSYMKRFYVDRDFRQSGVGTRLFDTFMDFARNKECRAIYLGTAHSMQAARVFYEKRGFKRIAALPPDMPQLPDDVFMRFEF